MQCRVKSDWARTTARASGSTGCRITSGIRSGTRNARWVRKTGGQSTWQVVAFVVSVADVRVLRNGEHGWQKSGQEGHVDDGHGD